ncbi:glutathione S-transferase family protein [Altericroceibacterium spongiae]|uniref:Glutathione S-transferase family protein n=1 Tax=Altericroceibacterium spongiae TaxID=2320269 RepID=A0A420ECD2_9SPHN|nr:glutathione S-transferase family protein [Altericroceibacterium spongiae]RKF18331.1 glutathione S-transferase family protein [Altericroceibacterium spongiae]
MAQDNIISLLDLQVQSGCTISPYVWRIKYALKHKGFDIDIIPNGFTGIAEITDGYSDRVPVIKDDGTWIKDSWLIADYLDEKYPDRPMLYEGQSQKLLTKFIDGWMWQTIISPWFRCYIKDYYDHSLERDKPYVRESRERTFLGGRTIEEVAEGREERLPEVIPLLQPLRNLLSESKWLGGDQPKHVDYCVLSTFLWCGSICTIPPLHDDEPLRDWIERGLDLFDGLGRHPGMHPLFGLPGKTPQPRMPG